MIFESQAARVPEVQNSVRPLLQRKCACGGTPGPSGECAACEKKRRAGIQTKLAINAPGDKYEREADRMADAVMSGGSGRESSLSSSSVSGSLQREEKTPPPKDNYEEAKKKALDALKETPIAKQLKAKAEEMGAEFLSSVEGKIIAGTALGGALAGIIGSNSEVPVGIPELPLDFIVPGLKAKITWEGPSQNPTAAGLTLTSGSGLSVGGSYTSTPASPGKPAEQKAGLSLTIPLGGSSKKKGPSEKEKFRAETARLAAEQSKIREGQKTTGERFEDKAFLNDYVRSKLNDPLNPLALPGLGRPLVPEPERKWEEEESLQRKATSESASAGRAPPIVDEVLQSSGQPLDAGTRRFMEERFGHDFSNVRVHRDARADASARAVDALAYTVGRDIVFEAGRFAPETQEGRRLLAHELTHVVQQRGSEGLRADESNEIRDLSTVALRGRVAAPAIATLAGGPRVQAQKPKPDKTQQAPAEDKPVGPTLHIVIRAPDDAFTQDVTDYVKNTLGEHVVVVDNIQEGVQVTNTMAKANKVKYGRVRLIGHGSTTGGIKMTPKGETGRRFVTAEELEKMSADQTLQASAKEALAEGATVEFWGCYIGSNQKSTGAVANIFQADVKAPDATLRTVHDSFTRLPDHDEKGEKIPGRKGKWVTAISTDEIDFRVKEGNKTLGASFNRWLLAQAAKLEAAGDLPAQPDDSARITAMRSLFNRSGGKIKRALITSGGRNVERGDKKFAELWKTKKIK